MKPPTSFVTLLSAVGAVGLAATSSAPASQAIVKYDMTALAGWNLSNTTTRKWYFDQTQFVTSLQGLANRDGPRLYVRYNASQDDFWWARMTEPGGWLYGHSVENATSITDLLSRFAGIYNGVVVWDERVPATANLASTIAGCDNLLAIRYDVTTGSLYQQLVLSGPQLAVQVRLLAANGDPLFTGQGTIPGTSVPSSGSAKCDAYLWLVEHYLKTGKVDPKRMGYYLDGYWLQSWNLAGRNNHTLNNHDFVIARRGLVFDLNVWDDETPVDDPNQAPGTDATTLRTILRTACEQFDGEGVIHVAGFVPWAYKYTNWGSAGGTHEPVPTEWRYAEILSCFNAFMDADAIGLASMVNSSFFQHYPLAASYPQTNKPTVASLMARGILDSNGVIVPRRYVAHYVGDYDAAAWLYQKLPTIWTDPQRGAEPLSWAFNPNLCERFPLGMAWTRQTATANDSFVAGDSGAGYLNPGHLVPPRSFSGLPSGVAAWEAHCRRFFSQWDISAVGFIIDGYAPCMSHEVMDAYTRIAPDGVVAQKVPLQGTHDNMPFSRMRWDLPTDISQAATIVEGFFTRPMPQFDVFRSILQTPTWYKQLGDELRQRRGDEVMIVDLYTLLWLIREYEQHPEVYLWPQSPYGGVAQVQCVPGLDQGLTPTPLADGPVQTTSQQGRTAWRVAAGQYLYFKVDDAFHRRNGEPLFASVDYYDLGTGFFAIQYDADDFDAPSCGLYKSTGNVNRGSTGTWRTVTLPLPDARFANAQNGETDLRIAGNADNLLVGAVRVYYEDFGSLQVTIEPQEAVAAGAQWRLTSGPDTGWKNSGEIIPGIPAGSYIITFKALETWDAPDDQIVAIEEDLASIVGGSYVRIFPGDLDGDQDVDQSDFGLLQACISGLGIPQPDPACAGALLDNDPDVDAEDVSIFRQCFSGPGVMADPDCAN